MKVIANGFGERPVLKLMYAALIRATAQWRGITVTGFEQKQGEVIREEIAAVRGQRHASPVIRPRARRGPGCRGRAVRRLPRSAVFVGATLTRRLPRR